MLGICQVKTPCCYSVIVIPATYQDKTVICPNCNESFIAKETKLLPVPTGQKLLPAPVGEQSLVLPATQQPCSTCSALTVCPIQSQPMCPLQAQPVCPVMKKAVEEAAVESITGLIALVIVIVITVVITVLIVS